jgi:hypothetical protein
MFIFKIKKINKQAITMRFLMMTIFVAKISQDLIQIQAKIFY